MAPAPVKDVLLIGFGAVGIIYAEDAFILKKSGKACVTVVARKNYQIVNTHGVHIKSRIYGEHVGWKPDRVLGSIAEAVDRPYSYVLIATKATPDVMTTSKIVEPLLSAPYSEIHPQPTYVLLQNGLEVEVDLYQSLLKLGRGKPSIISAAVFEMSYMIELNVLEHTDMSQVTLGVYRHKNYTTNTNTPEEAALLEDIGSILKAGGHTVTIVSEVQRKKFSKNFVNVAFSSLATLTNHPISAIFRPPPTEETGPYSPFLYPTTADRIESYTIPAIKAVLRELLALGHAMGFPDSEDGIPSTLVDDTVVMVRDLTKTPYNNHRMSMLVDAQRGQPTEVEVIFGSVVRMAQEVRVGVPRVEMLYALLLVVQNQIIRKIESAC